MAVVEGWSGCDGDRGGKDRDGSEVGVGGGG